MASQYDNAIASPGARSRKTAKEVAPDQKLLLVYDKLARIFTVQIRTSRALAATPSTHSIFFRVTALHRPPAFVVHATRMRRRVQ